MENESVYNLLKDRYFLKNEKSWEDIAKRVSGLYEGVLPYVMDKTFMPGTPILLNGNTSGERRGTLSSCFPMGIEDSIEGIFDALKEAAIVTKMGGGVGYDFTALRGSGEIVKSINRVSSGPIPFMRMFNTMLDGIQQGGVRRGAGMGLLSAYHTNILDFINLKKDIANKKDKKEGNNELERMNTSVKLDNNFYDTLKKNPDKIHKVKNTSSGKEHDLKDENGNPVTIKQLWKKIVHNAWLVAEPGIFNETIAYDRCTNINLCQSVICNPCSEFTNIFNTSCCLSSISLTKIVKDDKFDWNLFAEVIKHATRFLNAVIDKNVYPTKNIEKTTLTVRPIGLGIMGLADMFYMLHIPYNSKEAFDMTAELARFETLKSMEASVELAKENKKSYGNFDYDLFMKANERFFDKPCRDIDVKKLASDIKKYGIYNSSFTSYAPTGSIATIAETSNGIEPVFSLLLTRRVEKLNKQYDKIYIVDKIFEEYIDKNLSDKKIKIFEEIENNKGSCQKCLDIPENMRKVFVVAGDLTPMEHLDILEASANNVSLSVSKTINMPKDAKEEDVEQVFLEAHKRGIIGVTVYRDGCRGQGVLVHKDTSKKPLPKCSDAPKRPKTLSCDIHHVKITKRLDKPRSFEYLVIVGLYEDGSPYEVFAVENGILDKKFVNGKIAKYKTSKNHKAKYDLTAEYKNIDGKKEMVEIHDITKETTEMEDLITRQVSLQLRHGIPVRFIIEQLEKSGDIGCFNKAIKRALEKYLNGNIETEQMCPECEKKGEKNKLIRMGGCIHCQICGYSPKCS